MKEAYIADGRTKRNFGRRKSKKGRGKGRKRGKVKEKDKEKVDLKQSVGDPERKDLNGHSLERVDTPITKKGKRFFLEKFLLLRKKPHRWKPCRP